MEDLEIAKYRKKKESNKSKSKAKSNHKHIKKECLIIHENEPYLASYCVICGKIDNFIIVTESSGNGFRRMLKADEVYEKYKTLERIKVKDLWQKYLPITDREEN